MTEDADLLEAGPTFEVRGTEINPAQQGYTIVHNYALYFWRPYLGNTAFALWELLLSFCYGETDIAYPSISRLARMLTNSDYNRAVVTGRRKAPSAALRGRSAALRPFGLEPLHYVQGKLSRAKPGSSSRKGQASYQGALAILRRERLVQVMRRGRGPTAHYTFRVLKALPLLRPEQVQCLSPALQRDHERWLERYAIPTAAYQQAFLGEEAGPVVVEIATPDLTPVDSSTTGAASVSTCAAPDNTKNPLQENPINQWWQDVLSELRLQLQPGHFHASTVGTQVRGFEDGVLTIQAASTVQRDKLQRCLGILIRRLFIALSDGQVRQVCFVAAGEEAGELCAH